MLTRSLTHLLADVGPESEELAVDPVERRLEEVALARVLRVEQIEQVQDELLVNVPLHQRWLQEVKQGISLDKAGKQDIPYCFLPESRGIRAP